jgi:CRP-like cAMP-binding protein
MDFRTNNHILQALDEEDLARLQPHLQPVDLPLRTVIEPESAAPEHIYFLEAGLSSVVAITPPGTQIEVGLYGCEGMSGSAIVHGVSHGPLRTLIQSEGAAHRIATEQFRSILAQSPRMLTSFLQWQQVFSIHMAHTALTNGRHNIEQRLARWILMSQDRLGGHIHLTHEFLSTMLGVRRAGVTTSIHILEGERLIKADRGVIIVRDREALIARAGDAYGIPEGYYKLVTGRVVAPPGSLASQQR